MKLLLPLLIATSIAGSAIAQTTPSEFQPDGILTKIVKTDEGPERVSVGDDIYNRNGEDQTLRSAASLKGRPASYFYTLQNDGTEADAFLIRGTKGNRFFRVGYFAGDRNVTGAMIGRGVRTGEVAAGEAFDQTVRAVVKPNGRAILRSKKPRRAGTITTAITAVSRGSADTDDVKLDRVLAKTFAKRDRDRNRD